MLKIAAIVIFVASLPPGIARRQLGDAERAPAEHLSDRGSIETIKPGRVELIRNLPFCDAICPGGIA